MEMLDYKSYVAAIAADAKEQIKQLRSGSQRVYDSERKRHGRIVRYDPVEHEVCDVQIVKTDGVIRNVPLMKLEPHPAFRFRAGHRINVSGWIGIVKKIDRRVVVKCTNGTKLKFNIEEETTGNYDSYMSNGKLPTWWDRLSEQDQDLFSTIDGVPYPGNRIIVTEAMERRIRDGNCFWTMKNWYSQVAGIMFRTGDLNTRTDIVKKVKIKDLDIEWETKMTDASFTTPSTKIVVSSAEVLAPLNQECCEEGSCRLYGMKGDEIIVSTSTWMNEKVQGEGAPRCMTIDEVDQPVDSKEWLRQHRFIEKCAVVRIISKKRFVEVRWEDGSLDVISVSDAMKMNIGPSTSEADFYEINIDTDTESVEKMPVKPGCAFPTNRLDGGNEVDEIVIPWLRNHFKKKDLVVDALRDYPSQQTVYGVVKEINHTDFTAVVDWYEVDERNQTKPKDVHKITSIFDLVHMDQVLDPLFRITWKERSKAYGSEVVCSRFGKTMSGFRAGYLRGINENGQIIATSNSSSWTLWPIEVERMLIVAHQTEDGDWTHCGNGFITDSILMKTFLPDYRIQQARRNQNRGANSKVSNESIKCNNINDFPRLRKLKCAPPCHKYYSHTIDTKSNSSANLHDPATFAALINHELKKTLLEMEHVFIYFCIYEDRPELVSALMLGKVGTVYEGGVFLFDIFFPFDFPNAFPKLDYICYATNLNPAFEDSYASGSIRPLKCLNTSQDQVSLSLCNPGESLISLNGSYEGFSEEDGQGDHPRDTSSYKFRKAYNLTDFVKYINDTLFTTHPEDLVAELYPESLSDDQLPLYHEFLIGKKFEALANLILCPYQPWEDFMQLYRPNINILLENAQGLFLNRQLGISVRETECYGFPKQSESHCEGSALFLKRRVQHLITALEADTSDQKTCNVGIENEVGTNNPENEVMQERLEMEEDFFSKGRKPCADSSYLSKSNSSSSSSGRFKVTKVGNGQSDCPTDIPNIPSEENATICDSPNPVNIMEQRLGELKFDESINSCNEIPASKLMHDNDVDNANNDGGDIDIEDGNGGGIIIDDGGDTSNSDTTRL